MDAHARFQKQLIALARSKFRDEEQISERAMRAFEEVPRHWFVERYRTSGSADWSLVTPENLEQHLSTIYADHPLALFGTDDDFKAANGTKHVSTISQPSFVLRLLDLLDIREGQRIFELGAGSGWNAALMARLVGPSGRVVAAEIIPELAEAAAGRLRRLGFDNVRVVQGEGGDGSPEDAPFDRAMFTAGAFDLPRAFHEQIRPGGLLVFVLKNKGGIDNLLVLEKQEDRFVARHCSRCGFVPMTGKYHLSDMEEEPLGRCLERLGLPPEPAESRPFWWGASAPGEFVWQTAALSSFLALQDERFCAIHNPSYRGSFAWTEPGSLAVAAPSRLLSYGTRRASESLLSEIKRWVELGMPTLWNLRLEVYPAGASFSAPADAWICRRRESVFVWSLPS